jgi:hypothetical protein
MAEGSPDVAASIAELRALLLGTESIDGFLREVAVLAAGTLGEGLSCGITLQPNGRPLTVASSDQLASQVDELQYGLDQGRVWPLPGPASRSGSMTWLRTSEVQTRQAEQFAQNASVAVGIAVRMAHQAVLTDQLGVAGVQVGDRPGPWGDHGRGAVHRRGGVREVAGGVAEPQHQAPAGG